MMAQPVPHQPTDRRRVKVYELRHNDWFDRGTGFCYACWVPVRPRRICASPPVWSIADVRRDRCRFVVLLLTELCARILQVEEGQPKEPRVVVESEDQPNRRLLETKIVKDDGFQKQQGMFDPLQLATRVAIA
jgi:protein phosphatase-4 regulatory subunit 3